MTQITPTQLAGKLAADWISLRLRVLIRVITNHYDTVLTPFALTVNQTTILAMPTLAGEVSPGARQAAPDNFFSIRLLHIQLQNFWKGVCDRSG